LAGYLAHFLSLYFNAHNSIITTEERQAAIQEGRHNRQSDNCDIQAERTADIGRKIGRDRLTTNTNAVRQVTLTHMVRCTCVCVCVCVYVCDLCRETETLGHHRLSHKDTLIARQTIFILADCVAVRVTYRRQCVQQANAGNMMLAMGNE